MVRALGVMDGRPLVICGISLKDTQYLKEGGQILLDLKELNVTEGQLLILYGDTEEEIIAELDEDFPTLEDDLLN